jgi:hypothetical protein
VAAAAPMCRLEARTKAPSADRECAGVLISDEARTRLDNDYD